MSSRKRDCGPLRNLVPVAEYFFVTEVKAVFSAGAGIFMSIGRAYCEDFLFATSVRVLASAEVVILYACHFVDRILAVPSDIDLTRPPG
jgi:hypothetical protein